jgi:hypothetical protein
VSVDTYRYRHPAAKRQVSAKCVPVSQPDTTRRTLWCRHQSILEPVERLGFFYSAGTSSEPGHYLKTYAYAYLDISSPQLKPLYLILYTPYVTSVFCALLSL